MVDYFKTVGSAGPLKIIYDAAIWLFLILRFIPFVKHYSDQLARNIYLGVLFSAIYASSVGLFVDVIIGHPDSELRVLAALVGANYLFLAAEKFWEKFSKNPAHNYIEKINTIWLLVSLVSFFVFELILGFPTFRYLGTESFELGQNYFVSIGRILSRSYVVFVVVFVSKIFLDLIQYHLRKDARLRLRITMALISMVFIGSHHFFVGFFSPLIVISDFDTKITQIYSKIAIVNATISALSIGIFASPRWLLDWIINGFNRIRFQFLKGNLIWLRNQAVIILGSDGLSPSRLDPQNGSAETPTELIIQIMDAKRLLISKLSQTDLVEIENQSQERAKSFRSRGYDYKVVYESVLMWSAITKIGRINDYSDPSNLSDYSQTIEELIVFYYRVAKYIRNELSAKS